jgi:hypothetical protein
LFWGSTTKSNRKCRGSDKVVVRISHGMEGSVKGS